MAAQKKKRRYFCSFILKMKDGSKHDGNGVFETSDNLYCRENCAGIIKKIEGSICDQTNAELAVILNFIELK